MSQVRFSKKYHLSWTQVISILLPVFIFSCHGSPDKSIPTEPDLSKVKTGMSYIEVLEVAGFPDEKINVGTVTDEFGQQTKTEEWHYGNNQLVVIINDTVNAVDLDVRQTYQKIQHIIDSARAAGDTSSMIRSIN
jgi:hypothetical protein